MEIPDVTNDVQLLENPHEFLKSIDCLLLDCDGVIWTPASSSGTQLIKGVKETLEYIHFSLRKRIIFITNNSTQSRLGCVKKFHGFGLSFVVEDMILCSSFIAGSFISKLTVKHGLSRENAFGNDGGGNVRVHVIGEPGLSEELSLQKNITLTTDGSLEEKVDIVLMGLDRQITYQKLSQAFKYLQHNGTLFIATNNDTTLPISGGGVDVGTGSLVQCLSTAVGRDPDYILGKPNPASLQSIQSLLNQHEIRVEKCCMIGDRLNTDISFGRLLGVKCVAVLTGVSSLEDVQVSFGSERPEYYIPSLSSLYSSNTT